MKEVWDSEQIGKGKKIPSLGILSSRFPDKREAKRCLLIAVYLIAFVEYSSGWLETHCVAQANLESDPSALAFQMLGLHVSYPTFTVIVFIFLSLF